MDIKGKKPTVRLFELAKYKWPKLHEMLMKRRRAGVYVQAAVTALLDQSGVKVVDVERDCDCPECAGRKPEDRPHDVDALANLGEHEVPMQVGIFHGALMHDYDEVVGKLGGVDTRSVNERDTKLVRKKIRQTSPGGITLLATAATVSPGDDWWYEGVEGRCVVLWQKGLCSIYYGAGGRVDAAKDLCSALGYKDVEPQAVKPRRSRNPKHEKYLPFHPRTADGLAAAVSGDAKKWTGNPDDVIGALYYPAYASAYFDALRNATDAVQADGLVPILQHVVERHRESAVEGAADEGDWQHSVSRALLALEDLAKDDGAKLGSNVLVEICHILQGVAAKRYDDDSYEWLSCKGVDSRLHLQALFCLTCFVRRLRSKTPPEVLEALTTAAMFGGQEGVEHRIVLGCALIEGLRSAVSDWYRENESLLFGEDSPDGMNTVLIRVCSQIGEVRFTNVEHPILDVQVMEKYHATVVKALDDEMRYGREWSKSETGSPVKTNDLVRHFICHVLRGSHGYEVGGSVRILAKIGPDAVSVAAHECGWLIMGDDTETKFVDRGVRFWEAVLDSSPEPAALYGFGWWALTESVDQETWERLMLRTCEAASGVVKDPTGVICRASSGGNPTTSGIRIIELVLRADKSLLNDLAVRHKLNRMLENGVSIDIS